MKTKQIPEAINYSQLWAEQYKPEILKHHEVPLSVVATALGSSVSKVQEQLRSGLYPYGVARPCKQSYRYEVYPLRLIAFIEGNLSNPQILKEGA
jgi:hypothetical protein